MNAASDIARLARGWNPHSGNPCGGGTWLLLALLLGVLSTPASALTVTRGPYLQIGTPTSIVVRWRTDTATDSKVFYGTSVGNLDQSVTVSAGRLVDEKGLIDDHGDRT